MGRFRTSQFNNKQYTSSEYTNKNKNIEILKYARSIINVEKETSEFKLDCMLKKYNLNENNCVDPSFVIMPSIYLAVFENYKSMINLLLEQANYDKDCGSCPDVPTSLFEGLRSEFCYDDYFKSISENNNILCKCIPFKDVDVCQVESGKLYPYGNFNNNNPNINKSLRRKLFLKCNERKICPTYIYCKCSQELIDSHGCKCCDFTVSFPFKNQFVNYVVSGCRDKILYEEANNETQNPSKSYEIYREKLNYNKHFQEEAYNSYSENYIINDFYKK